jgi:hypothetical protein
VVDAHKSDKLCAYRRTCESNFEPHDDFTASFSERSHRALQSVRLAHGARPSSSYEELARPARIQVALQVCCSGRNVSLSFHLMSNWM